MARRILYLVDSLQPGGAERGLVLTLSHLDRSRFEAEVAHLWTPDTLVGDLRQLGVPVRHLVATRGPRALLAVRPLAGLLRSGGFDLVHTQVAWSGVVGPLAGRRAGVPAVSHLINVDPLGYRAREMPRGIVRRARGFGALERTVQRRYVLRFIAISEAVREQAARDGLADRAAVTVIRRGIDLDPLLAAADEAPAPALPPAEGPTLLTVGRLTEQKGHRYLLDAMGRVLQAFPTARLLLVGEGNLRPSLEELAARLGDRVSFLGIRRDVPSLLRRADLFVFPSLWEGQGNALLEAMALGRPIVASRLPAIEEAVADGASALLVPPTDPAALAEAVVRLLGRPDEAARLGSAAAAAARRFDIRAATRELEALYDEVLGDR